MKKLIWLLSIFVLFPCVVHSASLKTYEIGRIYRDGKQTIIDVTYWEWDTTTEMQLRSEVIPKFLLKRTLVIRPDYKFPDEVVAQVLDKTVADTTEIQVSGTHPYTYNTKQGIVAKERIIYNTDVEEPEIYKEIDNRLVQMNEVEDEVIK